MTNILLITADQWRADCLGVAGHPVVKTPNIDLLAEEGVRFARHYAQAAPCSPARASLYTGLYQMNTRVVFNGTPLDRRHLTIAQCMRELGYEPTLFGYTDIGTDPDGLHPADPWLRTYEGILKGMSARVHLPEYPGPWLSWLKSRGHAIPANWKELFVPTDNVFAYHGKPPKFSAEETQTAFLVDEFGRWLDEQREPWFAHLSFLSPHPPFAVPEPYATMYSPDQGDDFVRPAHLADETAMHPYLAYCRHGQPTDGRTEADERAVRATYWGMVSEVDAQIGRVRAFLEAAGQWEDTIFVLTSDHGEQLGDHHLWGKLGFYDQSYHVPLIIRAPDMAAESAGRVVTDFTESIDVMPTILDLAGASVPGHLDGQSLKPYVADGPLPAARREAHFEFDFRDVVGGRHARELGLDLDAASLAVIRDNHMKYVHFAGLPPLLFDLQADPGELLNVADDPTYLGIRLQMAERLLSWRAQHLDRRMTGLALTDDGLVDGRIKRG